MADAIYNEFKDALGDGDIDLNNDTLKLALVNNYTLDIDNHTVWSDVSANEVSGTGYTAGGQALTSVTWTKDAANDESVLEAADVTWSSSTITADGAVLYRDTGTASTSQLIAFFDFGTDQSSSNGDFTVSWSANGILAVS